MSGEEVPAGWEQARADLVSQLMVWQNAHREWDVERNALRTDLNDCREAQRRDERSIDVLRTERDAARATAAALEAQVAMWEAPPPAPGESALNAWHRMRARRIRAAVLGPHMITQAQTGEKN